MKILTARTHGYLDYLTVVTFLLAPTLFNLSATPSKIAYTLAGVHLAMTLLTAFPLGIIKVIPFTIHGAIEFVVGILLAPLPWLLGFAADVSARNFYVVSAIVFFIVWLITDYKSARAANN